MADGGQEGDQQAAGDAFLVDLAQQDARGEQAGRVRPDEFDDPGMALPVQRRFPRYAEMADPLERREATVRLHAEGWNIASIAGYFCRL
jgi:hypothetical protein